MKQSSKIFVGMDVHKESIDITLAEQDGELRRFGTVGGDRTSLLKAVVNLSCPRWKFRTSLHRGVSLIANTIRNHCQHTDQRFSPITQKVDALFIN
jgi:hypothetical protein